MNGTFSPLGNVADDAVRMATVHLVQQFAHIPACCRGGRDGRCGCRLGRKAKANGDDGDGAEAKQPRVQLPTGSMET
jgi:hypothetical protein